jgi:hypothetical protein
MGRTDKRENILTMDLRGIERQIQTIDNMPLSVSARQNVIAAFQFIIDGVVSQLFGAAHERDHAASLVSGQVPEERHPCHDLDRGAVVQATADEAA